jgi:hypothetical protein
MKTAKKARRASLGCGLSEDNMEFLAEVVSPGIDQECHKGGTSYRCLVQGDVTPVIRYLQAYGYVATLTEQDGKVLQINW